MNEHRIGLLVAAMTALAVTMLFTPWEQEERIYRVYPIQRGPIVMMGFSHDLQEVRTSSAGYCWVWTEPEKRTPWFGTEVEYRRDWLRLGLEWAVLAITFLEGWVMLRSRAGEGSSKGMSSPARSAS
jgi:hypothetical protein